MRNPKTRRFKKMYQDITTNCILSGSDYTCTTPFSTATNAIITPTITSGEILISFFLFLLVVLKLIQILLPAIKSVSVHRKMVGGSMIYDGKEEYEL